MSKNMNIFALKEDFNKTKDTYVCGSTDNDVLLTLVEKIIVPSLKIDVDVGVDMWEYMLRHYYDNCYPNDYRILTEYIVEQLDFEILRNVFSKNAYIKEYCYRLNSYHLHTHCERFIRDLIVNEDFKLAEELIFLYSNNKKGKNKVNNNIYSLAKECIESYETIWYVNSAGIDFLSTMIPIVESTERKDKLKISLLKLIDYVEGNVSRGGIPFSLLMKEGGLQKLMDEKKREQNGAVIYRKTHTVSSYDEVMKNRQLMRNSPSTKFEQACSSEHESAKEGNESHTTNTVNTTKSTYHNVEPIDQYELDTAINELNSLVGLNQVKNEVASLTNLMHIHRIRTERGMAVPDTSQHLVFSGNPGTGKTTVARIIGKIYHALGFLSKGHLVEVDRSGLVAGYVGQTALKAQEVIQNALGGILFIDEAYSLAPEQIDNDFGLEAINTILKAMEDNRDDFVVIVAGYDSLMPRFINSNPGLKSRFNKYIYFPDYDGNDLFAIFNVFLKNNEYTIEKNAADMMEQYLHILFENRDDNFGNARDVRNLFEKIITKQADRLVKEKFLSNEMISCIMTEDIERILHP